MENFPSINTVSQKGIYLMGLTESEKEYIDIYKSQSAALENAFKKATASNLTLYSNEFIQCLIQRMKAYYETQNNIKRFLNKRYAAPAADYFVESVLYFLKLALEISNSKLEAHSERQIKRSRNSIRPDISIWKDDSVVSIIECKTQLGWNRSNWESDFKKREQKLRNYFPQANAYLLVMTGNNWGGFSQENISSKKYYCILNDTWPTETDMHSISNVILTPIENLFKEVLKNG
jgi:hypothetical protein